MAIELTIAVFSGELKPGTSQLQKTHVRACCLKLAPGVTSVIPSQRHKELPGRSLNQDTGWEFPHLGHDLTCNTCKRRCTDKNSSPECADHIGYACTCTDAYARVYICTCVYTYVYMYIHVYVCTQARCVYTYYAYIRTFALCDRSKVQSFLSGLWLRCRRSSLI